MNEAITISRQHLDLLLVLFTFVGSVFGYVLGRIHSPKPSRPAIKRHTRSHG